MRRALGLLLVGLALLGIGRLWMGGQDGPAQASPVRSAGEQGVRESPGPSVDPVVVGDHGERRASDRALEEAPAEPPATASTANLFPVGGVVLDEAGLPISDAVVFIGAAENPFGDEARSSQWDQYTGVTFPVGTNGEFHAELPSAQSVLVWADGSRRTVEWISELESQAWVKPPREDLVLRLRHVPYGTFVVRVHDAALGADLERFQVSVSPTEGRSVFQTVTTEGVLEIVVPKIADGGCEYVVRLLSPKTEPPVRETLHLANGETREVLLQIQSDRTAGGVVMDSAGAPIEGVLVYFGELSDEAGDVPDPSRVGGALSDSRGLFQVSGSVSIVSFWHPRYQPRTLPASEGMSVALGNRGRIVGRLQEGLDPGLLRLDEDTAPDVQPDGSFVFEHVSAGLHLVQLPGGELLSVALVADETVEIGQEERLADVVLRLHAAGQPLEGESLVSLVGLDPVASCTNFFAVDGTAKVGTIIPGPYLLTLERHASIVSIDLPEITVDVGEHRLTVRSAGGGSYLLMSTEAPAMSDQVRNWLGRDVAPGKELEFGPLPSGTYALTELNSGREWTVELLGTRALDLP